MTKLTICGRSVLLDAPETPADTLALFPAAGAEEIAASRAAVSRAGVAFAAVTDADWNAELSPWPAARAFRGGEDFAGGASAYLRALTRDILPGVERALGASCSRRALVGYSLAGLFSLWALHVTDAFLLVGSVSGSLWYDGFSDFMAERAPMAKNARVYLSLGDAEAKTKNARLARVADETRAAYARLRSEGASAALEWNPGGHFQDAPGRVAKALHWLLDG